MAEHNTLTGTALHEPKGADSASSGQVYVADGAGSGSFQNTGHNVFADMYIAGGSTAHLLAGGGSYTKFNPSGEWTDGEIDGLTTSPANGEITLDTAGTYLVSFWCSFTTASLSSNVQYLFKYAVDGSPGPRVVSVQKNTGSVDHLHLSASGMVTVTAGQVLSIHVAGDGTTSGTNFTATDAGLMAVLVKEA